MYILYKRKLWITLFPELFIFTTVTQLDIFKCNFRDFIYEYSISTILNPAFISSHVPSTVPIYDILLLIIIDIYIYTHILYMYSYLCI